MMRAPTLFLISLASVGLSIVRGFGSAFAPPTSGLAPAAFRSSEFSPRRSRGCSTPFVDRPSSFAVIHPSSSVPLRDSSVPLDLDVVSLVVGQETYGFAIVSLIESIWSFSYAPSIDNVKVLVPGIVASVVLAAVCGPMVTSGNPDSVALGLEIASLVSIGLGASFVARLLAPSYGGGSSPKEIAFLGLLVSIAGFFSFSQNLVVDGFVTLPSLPSVSLPTLPSFDF